MTQSEKITVKRLEPYILQSIEQTMDEVISRFFKDGTGSYALVNRVDLVAAIYDDWVDYSRDQVACWYISLRSITIKLKEIETGKVPQSDIVRWVGFSADMFARIGNKISANFQEEDTFPSELPKHPPLIQSKQSIGLPSSHYKAVLTTAKKLEQALIIAEIRARVLQVHVGPTVCSYEIQVEIESDSDIDLVLEMESSISSALSIEDIRILPCQPMHRWAIEIPIEQKAIVTLKEMMDGQQGKVTNRLNIPFGKESSSGTILWGSLRTMPHLLLCGASESGKTASLRSMLCHFLLSNDSDKLHISLIQESNDGLNMLNKAPHVVSSVQNDPAKAYKALHEVLDEMENRFSILKAHNCENLEQYHAANPTYVPSLVVVIDESTQLLAFDRQAVEDAIGQLTARGHLVGIHMILAAGATAITDNLIRNFPTRLVFALPSLESSIMLLDQSDAEKLSPGGDALFRLDNCSQLVRIQTAYASISEVKDWVDSLTPKEKEKHPVDEIYERAVEFVVDSQTASASMLQRKFRIGYSRASRLIDHMEKKRIIGPYEGSKPREVLVKRREKSEVK